MGLEVVKLGMKLSEGGREKGMGFLEGLGLMVRGMRGFRGVYIVLSHPQSHTLRKPSALTLQSQMEQGIASSDIQKLNDAGYHTVESIAHATVRKLSEVKGISENKVRVGVVVRGGLCSF